MYRRAWIVTISMLTALAALPALAREQEAVKLANAVQNPVPDLISAPFHYNSNFGVGPGEETQLVRTLAVAPATGAAVPQLT